MKVSGMVEVNEELIKRLERLSLIKLTPEERERMIREVKAVLDFFDKINSLDLSDVEPLFHPLAESRLREDSPITGLTQEEALLNAPRKENGFIVGPRIYSGDQS